MDATMGAAQDSNPFALQLANSCRPQASSVVYDGIFNEHFMKASETELLLEPFGHCAVDRMGRLCLGIEVVSVLDGKPRSPDSMALDVVLVLDVSGSMGSTLGDSGMSKLAAAKQFAVIFDDISQVLLNPTLVADDGAKKVEDAVTPCGVRGGTTVQEGLKGAQKAAQQAKKLRGDEESLARIVLLTDMNANEVTSAKEAIQIMTIQMAREGIYVSYIGIGEDFNQKLTEIITVASGSNYFCILNKDDFDQRVSTQISAVFYPVVQEMELHLLTKQYRVEGIYGAGKEGKFERVDPAGWTEDKSHLYGEAIQTTVDELHEKNVPNDLVSIIVNQIDTKPIVVTKEKSVFPSPSTKKPGYMKGGWIIIDLEPEATKGDAGGFVRIELHYRKLDGTLSKCVKDVDLSEAEKIQSSGAKNWASSEGLDKAVVLKQYVDGIKKTLSDDTTTAFPAEFLEWIQERVTKYELEKEHSSIMRLSDILAKTTKGYPLVPTLG